MNGVRKISPDNLTRPEARLFAAPRCRATAKSTRQRCRGAAVKGYAVCRMHGARGGAPKGNRNAWKHGGFSAEAHDQRKRMTLLVRVLRSHLV
jgi:hypothetical protein